MKKLLLAGGMALILRSYLKDRGKCPLPSFKGIIETKHFLPGRIRFLIPSLKQREEVALSLQKQLSTMTVVKKVAVNSISGSVLIEYAKDDITPIVLMGAVMKLTGLDIHLKTPRCGKIRQNFGALRKVANDSIIDATHGILDFNTVLALVLLGSAGYIIKGNLRNLMAPNPVVLAWWAYNSL